MFQGIGMLLRVCSTPIWLAQVSADQGINSPEQAALVFSGPQFFVALISGVVLAFAFQLLLTNLSVATGISILGRNAGESNDDDHESGSLGGTIRKIGFAVGIWTLVTVSIALFLACLLAVKLSLVSSWSLGVITALVIWGAYFSILVWVSSTTVGSLIGSVVNTATSGFQAIVGTATAALAGKAVNDQVVATAEAAASAVRRELGTGIDPETIRENIEDYLGRLRPPELDLSKIRSQFESLVNDPDLKSIAASGGLSSINRQTFVDLVGNRTDLSKRDLNRIVDQLESVWQQITNIPQRRDVNAELLDFLRSAQPEALKSDQLTAKLDELIAETRKQRESTEDTEQKSPGLMDRVMQAGMSTLTAAILGRTDLSDLDVEQILGRLQQVRSQISDQASKVAEKTPVGALPFSTVKADIENYLSNAYPWHLNRETLNQEFRDLIYDPDADPAAVRRQLEQIDRAYFADVLNRRNDLSSERISVIADQLEEVRQQVLTTLQAAATDNASDQGLQDRVANYLSSTNKEELDPQGIERDFRVLLADPGAGFEALRDRLNRFDRDTFVQLLSQRQDISPEEASQIVDNLLGTRDRVITEAQSRWDQAKSEAEAQWVKLESYLRNTNKEELDPDGIKRDLQTLLDDPKAGAGALRQRLSQVDRDTLVQLLSQRQDLSEEQVNEVIDQVQETIRQVVRAPRRWALRTQQTVQDFQSNLGNYLRNTDKEELNPEGIKRDLQLLMSDPKTGFSSLGDRVSQFDRSTFVALLAQRPDMTEADANQIADQVESSYRQVIEQIQGIQQRIQSVIDGVFARIRNYLNSLERPELNYDGIKQDVRQLFDDPQAGFDALRDRLGHFNRDTLVAVLSSREDISEADVNRVIDQIEGVRTNLLQRAERLGEQARRRVEAVKLQAQRQAEETRKAAETAAWWLFGTALVSAGASALAGAVAVLT